MAAARSVASNLAVVLGILLLAAGGAWAQSSPPSTTSGCTSVLVSLSPCLSYISGNQSTAPAPCCAQLGKVVASDPQCLCVALNADPAALGISVNRTRALGLPDECKVKTPPLSDCKKGGAAPSGAPAGETAPASGGSTGSKTTPSTNVDNGASPRGSAGLVAGAAVVTAVLAVAAI